MTQLIAARLCDSTDKLCDSDKGGGGQLTSGFFADLLKVSLSLSVNKQKPFQSKGSYDSTAETGLSYRMQQT